MLKDFFEILVCCVEINAHFMEYALIPTGENLEDPAPQPPIYSERSD